MPERDHAGIAYKILTADQWSAFVMAGTFAGAPIDLTDGYIHLSGADTVVETAARHFDAQDDLVLATIDLTLLGGTVRWEASRGGALFPHVYGVLPMAAVTRHDPLMLDWAGKHIFPKALRQAPS